MYLSLNHLCFYAAGLLGSETKLVLRYSDMVDIVRSSNTSVTVHMQSDRQYRFVILFNATEANRLLQELSKMTMQNMLADPEQPTIAADSAMLASPRGAGQTAGGSGGTSTLLRNLNARQHSDQYRVFFRLPLSECLDGQIKGKWATSPFVEAGLGLCVVCVLPYFAFGSLCERESEIDRFVLCCHPLHISTPIGSFAVAAVRQTLCGRHALCVAAFPLLQERHQRPSQPLHTVQHHSGANRRRLRMHT